MRVCESPLPSMSWCTGWFPNSPTATPATYLRVYNGEVLDRGTHKCALYVNMCELQTLETKLGQEFVEITLPFSE